MVSPGEIVYTLHQQPAHEDSNAPRPRKESMPSSQNGRAGGDDTSTYPSYQEPVYNGAAPTLDGVENGSAVLRSSPQDRAKQVAEVPPALCSMSL
jgi:hypothetical protein